MIYTFSAVISESDGTFYARVPDIEGCITASTLSEAIRLIADALSMCLIVLEDESLSIPSPTNQAAIPHSKGNFLTLVQADTIAYRARCILRPSAVANAF